MNAGPEPNPLTESPEGSAYLLSLEDLLRVVWQRLWVILLVVVLVVVATVGYGLSQTPSYEASIKMWIGLKQDAQGAASEGLGSEVMGLQQLTLTMVEAVDTRRVAEAVIREQDLQVSPEVLLENVSVEQLGSSQFIEVSYRDSNPRRAQQVADTIGEVFSRQVAEESPSTNAIAATLWDRAPVPEDPVSPDFLIYTLVALVLGTMLGVGLAFVLEYLDDSWRSAEEVEQVSGVPTFGIIPEFKVPKRQKGKG